MDISLSKAGTPNVNVIAKAAPQTLLGRIAAIRL
jgi:hypothetical protein